MTSAQPAFTLVEVVLALGLTAIVMVGLRSAILVAGKALPDASPVIGASLEAAALRRLNSDVRYAKSIDVATATTLTITVPDQDDDGVDDQIEYSWSGTAGDPMYRRFNATAREAVLKSVESLAFTLDTVTDPGISTYKQSIEVTLASHTTVSGAGANTIASGTTYAQFFPVTLPADATAFNITKVLLMARYSGTTTGQSTFEIRGARAGAPMSRVYEKTTLLESSLGSSYAWTTIALPGTTWYDPAEQMSFVIALAANSVAGDLQGQTSGANSVVSGVMGVSTDNGVTWNMSAGKTLQYQVLGTYQSAVPGVPATRATAVRAVVSSKASGRTRVSLTIPLSNEPKVAP